jgi:ammonium transporter, Amt family
MSLLCWTICDMIYFKKPSVLGAVQGMITGLVAITPAAGVVAGWGAICIGFASGTIPVRTPPLFHDASQISQSLTNFNYSG